MKNYVISAEDHDRISQFLTTYRPFLSSEIEQIALLKNKLRDAVIVPESRLARTIISMYSTAKVMNLTHRETGLYMLVYPHHANPGRRKLSILSPLGRTLLGCSEGDFIDFALGDDILKLAVTEVLQPKVHGELQR